MEAHAQQADDTTPQKSMSTISIAPLFHESQRLQLCALHALNNLLQLSPDNNEGISDEDESDNLILCSGKLYCHDALPHATKSEFNALADDLTSREAELYNESNGQNQDQAQEQGESGRVGGRKLSWWRWIRSQHRTPFTGNYSFEVLEAALTKRNIKMEWYNDVGSNLNDIVLADSNSLLIGFIINCIEPFSISKMTSVFTTSRHWFAITKVRRLKQHQIDTEFDANCSLFFDSASGDEIGYDGDTWHLVNSDEAWDMTSEQVRDFLFEVKNEKGSIFQATMMNVATFAVSNS